jgi:hypothetical protein
MDNVFYKYIGINVSENKEFEFDVGCYGFDFGAIINAGEIDVSGVMKDGFDIYIEIKEKGFCLLLKNSDGDYWFLNSIFFYGAGKDGYSGYFGSVIRNVEVGDAVALIAMKLGVPPDFYNDYIMRWNDIDGFKISFGAIEGDVPKVIIVSSAKRVSC